MQHKTRILSNRNLFPHPWQLCEATLTISVRMTPDLKSKSRISATLQHNQTAPNCYNLTGLLLQRRQKNKISLAAVVIKLHPKAASIRPALKCSPHCFHCKRLIRSKPLPLSNYTTNDCPAYRVSLLDNMDRAGGTYRPG